jgi:chemotaxis protein MotB
MGGGGGAWKVAYADFVTAMMAFFMVMWLTSQSSEVKEAVAEHFRNPSGSRLSGQESRSIASAPGTGSGQRRISKERGNKKTDGDAKKQQMNDEGARSNVGKVIPFALNSTTLDEKGKSEIKKLLPELEGKQFKIEVRGHSASNGGTARQSAIDSLTISYQRAMSVFNYLVDQGIDFRRVRVTSAGSSEPKYKDNELDPSQDSRVEVFLLTEMFEEPASKMERMVSRDKLKDEAIRMEKEEKAAAEKEAAASGGH